jgi:uncharacterized protein involved in exopolysaccharide biosynthesis
VTFGLTSTPKYESKFELLVEPVTVENKLVSSLPQSLNGSTKSDTTSNSGGVDETALKVLQSPKLMEPIAKQIEQRYPGSGLPDIKLKRIDGTNILEVTSRVKTLKSSVCVSSSSQSILSIQSR